MCGIAGFVELGGGRRAAELVAEAAAMAAALHHRGPDGAGTWADAETGVAFGHARLAVVDLTEAGRQPMTSASGRFVITFNGEIYEHEALRDELAGKGAAFRGRSDTEVLLAAVEAFGLRGALERCVGMFAFALLDRERRDLHLVRDRLGEKPLYHGVQARAGRVALLFGSELPALRAHAAWDGEVSREALTSYLRFGYLPAPLSIHRGIAQLPPGCLLTFGSQTLAAGPAAVAAVQPLAWWSAADAARAGIADPFTGSDEEAADAVEEALGRAVAGQLVADVPLGAFLSGGIDSSAVVALMAARARGRVRTFTIGFREQDHDESAHARAIAAHLGTRHEQLIVTPEEALAVIPRLATLSSEPLADPSQVPTFLVAQLARRHVTVALSGDGGDELFAGYDRHVWALNLQRTLGRLPGPVRRAVGRLGRAVPEWVFEQLARLAGPLAPRAAQRPGAGARAQRLFGIARAAGGPRAAYRRLVSLWEEPGQLVPGAAEPLLAFDAATEEAKWRDPVERLTYLDLVTYLPGDILVKVDRAAMATSLETRVPLLDHRLVELAFRLPPRHKLRGGEGKHVLRRVLERHVPKALFERPKTGFGVPLSEWLRGPLRPWAEDLLSEASLTRSTLVEAAPVRAAWAEHLSGQRPHPYRLWAVLMLIAWQRQWMP